MLGLRSLRGGQHKTKFLLALFSSALSVLITISPLLWAWVDYAGSGYQGELFSEGPGGHGAILWLLLVTVPTGGLGFLITTIGSWIMVLRKG